MTPLFKTHYSLGGSILSLSNSKKEGGYDGVFDIAEEEGMEEIVLVEDSLVGLRKAFNEGKKRGVKVIFGLRYDSFSENQDEDKHKVIYFAKNDQGFKDLKSIFSQSFETDNAICLNDALKNENIKVAIPFYDSYLFRNNLEQKHCIVNDPSKIVHFVEIGNEHPFDLLIEGRIKELKVKTEEVKSIYYKKEKDFKFFQFYKSTCMRSGIQKPSVSKPELNHCGSDRFSWETFKKIKNAGTN